MSWRVIAGPVEAPWEGIDARGWAYELERESEWRPIIIEVAGPAYEAVLAGREGIAELTRRAVETQGLSEVEKVLDQDRLPARIALDSNGYVDRR
jgi:hypothetical protein